MKRRKIDGFRLVGLRTLFLMLAMVMALVPLSGVLMLCENPLPYVSVAAVAVLLLSGLVYGMLCPRDEGILFSVLSPLLCAVLFLICGILCSGGHLSFGALINYPLFLLCSLLGRMLPRKKRKRSF